MLYKTNFYIDKPYKRTVTILIWKLYNYFYKNFVIIFIVLELIIFEKNIYKVSNFSHITLISIKSLEEAGMGIYINFCLSLNVFLHVFICGIDMDKDDFYYYVKIILVFILFMLVGYSVLQNIILSEYILPQMKEFVLFDQHISADSLASLDSLDILNKMFKYNYFFLYTATAIITVFFMLITKPKY